MGWVRIDGHRIRIPGTCWNHRRKCVEGKAHCQQCLDKLKGKYQARKNPVHTHMCLRCGVRGKRKWQGRLCCYCRRTLRNSPDAEIRRIVV